MLSSDRFYLPILKGSNEKDWFLFDSGKTNPANARREWEDGPVPVRSGPVLSETWKAGFPFPEDEDFSLRERL